MEVFTRTSTSTGTVTGTGTGYRHPGRTDRDRDRDRDPIGAGTGTGTGAGTAVPCASRRRTVRVRRTADRTDDRVGGLRTTAHSPLTYKGGKPFINFLSISIIYSMDRLAVAACFD